MLNDRTGRDAGFTLIEISVVILIATIILYMATSSLVSLDRAASRGESLVQEEQAASTVMAQMERDIRSAATISIPAAASPADEIDLAILGTGGSVTNVRWVYDQVGQIVSRETAAADGSYSLSGASLTHVTNGTAVPVFSYYDGRGSNISGQPSSDISLCATAVNVDFRVTPTTPGVGSFEETSEVALTNQVAALNTPGNGQCT